MSPVSTNPEDSISKGGFGALEARGSGADPQAENRGEEGTDPLLSTEAF
jgi:hypothetical protein